MLRRLRAIFGPGEIRTIFGQRLRAIFAQGGLAQYSIKAESAPYSVKEDSAQYSVMENSAQYSIKEFVNDTCLVWLYSMLNVMIFVIRSTTKIQVSNMCCKTKSRECIFNHKHGGSRQDSIARECPVVAAELGRLVRWLWRFRCWKVERHLEKKPHNPRSKC